MKITPSPIPRHPEFTPNKATKAFAIERLPVGLCLGSKSGYRETHPRHCLVPNANVICRAHGKIWWGDLDLHHHHARLERVARRLRTRLYVLREHDARFERSNLSFGELYRLAVWHTGGRIRADRGLMSRSGLEPKHLALLIGVSGQRLTTPQLPFVTQQINRRLLDWEESIGALARELGFKKWGTWLQTSNTKLANRSPFMVLRNGGTINFAEVFAHILSDKKRLARTANALIRGIALQYGTPIKLEWGSRP